MIYRLKAPTRKDIEEQIPFELYKKYEGNEHPVFATTEYSYHLIGSHQIPVPVNLPACLLHLVGVTPAPLFFDARLRFRFRSEGGQRQQEQEADYYGREYKV